LAVGILWAWLNAILAWLNPILNRLGFNGLGGLLAIIIGLYFAFRVAKFFGGLFITMIGKIMSDPRQLTVEDFVPTCFILFLIAGAYYFTRRSIEREKADRAALPRALPRQSGIPGAIRQARQTMRRSCPASRKSCPT
jgi:hypothetical protein